MSRKAEIEKIFKDHWPKMARMIERGNTPSAVAKKFKLSPATFNRKLTKEGYKHKARGRTPQAVKERSRDLFNRGWPISRISLFLKVEQDHIQNWIQERLESENIDRNNKKDYIKNPAPKASKEATRIREISKVPRHKRGRRWTQEQKEFVFKLIKGKWPPYEIYRIANASKARQRMIWQELGGKGSPPNLQGLERVIGEKKERRKEFAKKVKEAVTETLGEEQIVELPKLPEAEEKIEKALPKMIAKMEPQAPGTPEKRRVLPGSYEDEILKLPVGSLIEAPKELQEGPKKRMRVRKPKSIKIGKKTIKDFSNNGNYFEISSAIEFDDLFDEQGRRRKISFKNFKPDDLAFAADVMVASGVPTIASKKGGLPDSYLNENMPERFQAKYGRALDAAYSAVQEYKALKDRIKKGQTPNRINEYLATAFQAFSPESNLQLSERKQKEKFVNIIWQDMNDAERALSIFHLRTAARNGIPNDRALAMGKIAAQAIEQQQEKILSQTLESQRKKFGYAIYANNQKYFAISNFWPGLKDENEAELQIRAASLSQSGFPTTFSGSGKYPTAFKKEIAPPEVLKKWNEALQKSTSLRNEYRLRKRNIARTGEQIKSLSRFDSAPKGNRGYVSKFMKVWLLQIANMYGGSEEQRALAQERAKAIYQKMPVMDRYILTFDYKLALPSGLPSSRGGNIGRSILRSETKQEGVQKREELQGATDHSELAPNKKVFEVSNNWRAFKSDTQPELLIRAFALTDAGFPARVAEGGSEPQNIYDWPVVLQEKYNFAMRRSRTLIRKYKEILMSFRKKKEFFPDQKVFFQKNALAFDPRASQKERKKAFNWLIDYFRKLNAPQRVFAVFDLRAYEQNGKPIRISML